jgi:hypothetical protein
MRGKRRRPVRRIGGSVAHPLCRSARTAACESTCQHCERWVLESMSLNPDPVIETWQKLANLQIRLGIG